MFKTAIQSAPRRIPQTRTVFRSTSRRLLSTAPPSQKSRSWKSSAARWALAGGGVYYYNTSNLFAEEPESSIQRLDDSIHHVQESRQPTVDAIVEEKRRREAQRLAEEEQQRRNAEKAITQEGAAAEEESDEGGLGGLEEEADQQGAFNPETGEINFDCPCLGGMAYGPCGEEFRAAFSCFVYSTEEPKGVECIEKFKGMQDCFRAHPETYGSELEDDEDEVEEELRAREQASTPAEKSSEMETSPLQAAPAPSPKSSKIGTEVNNKEPEKNAEPHRDSASTAAAETTKSGDEGGDLIPKSAHDAS